MTDHFLLLLGVYLAVVFLPVIFWFWYFNSKDRIDPEPKRLLLKVFSGGIIATFVAGLIQPFFVSWFFPEAVFPESGFFPEDILDADKRHMYSSMFTAVLAGPVEEFLKFAVVYFLVFGRKELNQIADGAIYGVAVGLGFSILENTFYFFSTFGEFSLSAPFFAINVYRGLVVTMLHLAASALAGLYLARAKFSPSRKKSLMLKGLLAAMVIHSLFNLAVSLPGGDILSFGILVLVVAFVVRQVASLEGQKVRPS